MSVLASLRRGATERASSSFLDTILGVPRPMTSPRLPPKSTNCKEYTLILDLDETLLHTEWLQGYPERYVVHERPFVREFLRALKQLPVEVVVFTAGIQGYADTVIDIMDERTKAIHYRLYRQHTTACGYQRWKDLSLLNRDLNKTMIIDNSPEAFLKQPNNGLVISSWEGHLSVGKDFARKEFFTVEDFALINLFYWLEYLCSKNMNIPEFVCHYREPLREAVGYSSQTKATRNYIPPFDLGPLSIALHSRCALSLSGHTTPANSHSNSMTTTTTATRFSDLKNLYQKTTTTSSMTSMIQTSSHLRQATALDTETIGGQQQTSLSHQNMHDHHPSPLRTTTISSAWQQSSLASSSLASSSSSYPSSTSTMTLTTTTITPTSEFPSSHPIKNQCQQYYVEEGIGGERTTDNTDRSSNSTAVAAISASLWKDATAEKLLPWGVTAGSSSVVAKS